jgi:DNA-binding beta-propeller fold protein YncE
VAEAVSSDYANLYVANQDDSSIVQFIIGNDGKLYPQSTTDTVGVQQPTGSYPLALAVSGSNMFVLNTFQPLTTCSTGNPCSGSIGVYPILAASGSGSTATPAGELGTPAANGYQYYWPLTLPSKTSDVIVPTGINVVAATKTVPETVFVTAYDSSVSPTVGYVFGFTVATGGVLTPLNNGVPFVSGVHPSAVASDSSSSYVYVTDFSTGAVHGYAYASGLLTELSGSPYQAGNQPSAIVADSTYAYVYVANSLDGSVTAFSISNGALTRVGTYAAGIQPVAIGIDPSFHHFLYIANYLGNGANGTISGFELNTTDGSLINSMNSPYTSSAQPTAVAAIPHNQKK